MRFSAILTVASLLLLTACSSSESGKPAAAKPGTPAFFWAAAKSSFAAGDYAKANEHLGRLTKSELKEKSVPLQLVVLGGMVKGYIEYAEKFEYGAKANKSNPLAFRRNMNDAMALAQRTTLAFAENFESFEKAGIPEKIVLEVGMPKGSLGQDTRLSQVAAGLQPGPADIEMIKATATERGVLSAMCEVAGAPKDPAKLKEMVSGGSLEVTKEKFLLAMAGMLEEQAGLYVEKKLNDKEKMAFFLKHASEAIQPLPDSPAKKELVKKIETAQKAAQKKK